MGGCVLHNARFLGRQYMVSVCVYALPHVCVCTEN